jgi:N utilization substance protein B
MLFAVDVGRVPLREVLVSFMWDQESPSNEMIQDPEVQDYARQLVRGTAVRVRQIDKVLASRAEGWDLERLANVDRNLLRMATYEMMLGPEMPEGVVINEAVDLAKMYSTEESGKFVNGLLGTLSRERPAVMVELEAEETDGQDESGSSGGTPVPEG